MDGRQKNLTKCNFIITKKTSICSQILSFIGNVFFCYCLIIALQLIIFSSVTIECRVVGESMIPTFNADPHLPQDIVYVNVKDRDFAYGDIVVINVDDDPDPIIKRVIGVAGDKIDIVYTTDGYKVEVNGKIIEEDYIRHSFDVEKAKQNGIYRSYEKFLLLKETRPELFVDGKLLVGEGQIFAMGDNRFDSKDSTHYGNFDVDDVLGTVDEVRYADSNEFAFYWDYVMSGRFFETLGNCF